MKKIVFLLLSFFFLFTGDALSQPVRIAYLQSDIHHLPLWVAMEKGLFEKEGVRVEVAGIFKAGPEMMSAFTAGSLDMGFVGNAPTITALANRTVRVAILAQVNTEGSAIVVRKDGKLHTLPDLVGKGVAIPGHATVQDFLLRKAFIKHNIQADQVKTIVLKPPEMIGALRTGQIDAFIAWEPHPAKAQTIGVGRVLAHSRDIWKAHPCCGLVADSGFLETHPQKVKAVVRGHVAATDFIQRHREEAIQIAIKYTGMDDGTIRLAMENVHFTYVPSVGEIREYIEFLTRLKYIRVEDTPDFLDRLIRTEILKEVIKR
jgi:NitT/TauT family transport system substrate-binding protein